MMTDNEIIRWYKIVYYHTFVKNDCHSRHILPDIGLK